MTDSLWASILFLIGACTLANGEFDTGFSAGRTFPAEVGDQNAIVWCRGTHRISGPNRKCSMTLPEGLVAELDLDTGVVRSENTVLPQYMAYTDEESRTCGIKISTISLSDLGQYRCRIEYSGTEYLPEIGFISLLNNTEGFVKDVRIPRHVIPQTYNLKLTPFIVEDNYTVKGVLDIHATSQKGDNNCDNKCIVLHTRDTFIDESSITVTMDGIPLQVVGVGYDINRDFLIIYTKEFLLPNLDIQIHIDFVSQIQDNLAGFYRSTYVDRITNTTKTIATTQFESTDARRAFPCFDEPDLKAEFTVGIGRRKNMISLSNMESDAGVVIDDEYVMDLYQPSVKMSTYLLAFVVCEFGSTYAQGHENFKVWAQEDRIGELEYAARIGPEIINFYEELFDYKFPLQKMDMIAIPDFQSGAMENWGLITYRDTAILYDNVSYSASSRLRVSTVVAHELAHQWFGNLVTMKWWNDLWLNEGFASYIEYLGADFVEPEMKFMEQLLNYELHDVFYLDSLPSSHPIKVDIQNPIFQENFDRISYGKGSMLIRMMANFLTEKTFRQGLANYFKENAYANAEQDDLWKALNLQAHEDEVLSDGQTVKEIMDTWTLQKGYPVLHVSLKDNVWELKQEKFNLEKGFRENEDYLWWVPVSYKSIDGNMTDTTVDFWLNETVGFLPAPEDVSQTTYIFNVGEMGYYRVNYDTEVWSQLISSFSKLPSTSRAQLFDDALNLARAGILPYSTALELTSHLSQETDLVALKAADKGFEFLENMLGKDSRFTIFKEYLRNLLEYTYSQFSTSESTAFFDVQTRAQVMMWACSVENQDCIKRAVSRFAEWKSDNNNSEMRIDPDSKTWVYCYGIKYGTAEDWQLAWDRLQTTTSIVEKKSLMSALGCSRDVEMIDKYLKYSIDPTSTVRTQDKRYLYGAIGKSEADGSQRMLDWLETNWEAVKEFYGDTFVYNVKSMFKLYPETASSQDKLDSLSNFLQKHRAELGSSADTADQGLDKIKANIKWRSHHYEEVFGLIQSRVRDRQSLVLSLNMK